MLEIVTDLASSAANEGVVLGWQVSLEGGQAAVGRIVMFSSEVLA